MKFTNSQSVNRRRNEYGWSPQSSALMEAVELVECVVYLSLNFPVLANLCRYLYTLMNTDRAECQPMCDKFHLNNYYINPYRFAFII
jgi:hypothetical protein